jgi:hypothetical protein
MGLPSDGSVLPLRSAVLTSTRCPRETLKHLAKQAGPLAPPLEVWAPGSQGTPAGLRAQPAQRVRASRRAQLSWRRWRAHAHARRRERGFPCERVLLPARRVPAPGARRPLPGARRDGLARAPLARSPAPPPPRTRRGPAPALCAGAAGRGSIRAFPQPSGGRAAAAGASHGRAAAGRRQASGALSPEDAQEERLRPGAGLVLLWRRAHSSRNPEMHLHQVLTGAVNPGDNCYSVGSVGDVPFTVSRAGASRRAVSDEPTHAPWALGLGGGRGRMRNHRPRPPARPPGECAGGGDGRFGAAPGSAVPGGRCWQRPKPGAASTCSWLAANGLGLRVWRRCCSLASRAACGFKRALCISLGRILAYGNRKIRSLPERVRMEVTFS